MKRSVSGFGWMAGVGLVAIMTVGSGPGRAQSQSFGVNSQSARTNATITSIRNDRIGRQEAVSSAIVNNTPDLAAHVYWNTRLTREARVYQNLRSSGGYYVQDLARLQFENEQAGLARLAELTGATLRERQRQPQSFYDTTGTSGNPSGWTIGRFPGSDLLGPLGASTIQLPASGDGFVRESLPFAVPAGFAIGQVGSPASWQGSLLGYDPTPDYTPR